MGMQGKKNMTVAQLIVNLKKLPQNALWYGWEDETLIVENPVDTTKYWIIDPAEPDPTAASG